MTAWYERSFGEDYLLVYKHRDYSGAHREVQAMANWLALPTDSAVLDLCCGMGRHSLALTEYGYKVTGVDLSEVLLDSAIRSDPEHQVTWVRGDMRDVPLQGPFDAVFNLFTSFGYFNEDRENVKVLKEIDRLLKPDGRFLIDFLNAGYVRRTLVPSSVRQDGDTVIKESRRIEDGFVKKEIVIQNTKETISNGSNSSGTQEERQYSEQVRLYELADFQRMLKETDLSIDRIYGAYDGSAYSEQESNRLIMIGTKRGVKA